MFFDGEMDDQHAGDAAAPMTDAPAADEAASDESHEAPTEGAGM